MVYLVTPAQFAQESFCVKRSYLNSYFPKRNYFLRSADDNEAIFLRFSVNFTNLPKSKLNLPVFLCVRLISKSIWLPLEDLHVH